MNLQPNDIGSGLVGADSLPNLLNQINQKPPVEEEKKEVNPWDLPPGLDLNKLP